MENNYHTKADLSDYVEREIKLISPFFRLTKKVSIVFITLLLLSFSYYTYKIITTALSLNDPFANFSFDFIFIVMLLELNCLICMFPAFVKKEYSLFSFILITFFATSLINKHFVISILILWLFISFKLWLPAVNRGKLKYHEYCSNSRINKNKEDSIIYAIPELTVSIDAKNGYAPPIDNSNLFKKKSIYDEDIEQIDINKIFKPKNNDPEQ